MCLLLLAPRAVLAAPYNLPADIGNGPFSSCSGSGPGYNCSGSVSLNNNDTVTLTADVTLNITGDFDVGRNVVIDDNGFSFTIDASGDINLDDGAQASANLDAAGKIDLGKNVVVDGNVTSGDDITIGDDTSITGSIDSAGKLDIKKRVVIIGDVTAIDDVSIGDDANINGNISSGGKIDIDKDAIIVGDITAVDDIKTGDDANITGNITSGGKIDIGKRAVITGDLNANDDIKIEQDIVINGDVTTTGNLDIDNSSVVNGVCTPFHPNCTGGPPGSGCETFRDEFSNVAYNNQDGTLNWATPWNEILDDGLPNSGRTRINGSALRLDGGLQPSTVLGGRYIEREADLSGYANATLTFNYRETGGWEANDTFQIYVSADGGLNWNLIQTFADDQGATYQPFSADISAYVGSNTRIAFVTTADNNGERFFVDDVQIEVCTPVPLIDHFRITPAATSASTCLPNAITIVAEDASNNTLTTYTGSVNISTSTANGNWSVNSANNTTSPSPDNDDDGAVSYGFLLSDAGDIILDLSNTHAETLTITVTDPTASVSSTSVSITYSSNVFIITEDPVQVAGRPMAMNIAMWTDDLAGSASCGIDTNYNANAQDLVASIDRGGVLNGAINPSIGGTTIPDALDLPATATITLDFSVTPGQANFNLDSSDVGQYRLTLEDSTGNFSSSTITGSSAPLTVRPFGIAVTNIRAGATLNPGATAPAPGGALFTTAGADFEATVAGVLWASGDDANNDGVLDTGVYLNNAVAPSYAWDTVLDVSTAAASYTPDPGTPGILNNGSILAGEFSGGSFTVNDLQYTEVGSFTLQSSASDFLGETSADIVGDDIVIGRFRPAGFDVVIADNGAFAETCGAFSYVGQPFNYATAPRITVRALNALGGVTAQYRDGFNTLSAGSITVNVTEDETTNGTDMLPLQVSYTAAAMGITKNTDGTTDYVFGADSYRYGPSAPVGFSKYAESQVPPFPADIDPEISAVSDAEITTSFPADTYLLNPAGNNQRFGRLRMSNVHGSELNALLMPVYTEFWDGVSFQKNMLDICTTIAIGDLLLSGAPPGLSVPVIVNAPALLGDVDYSFPSPGAGNDGYVDTITDLNLANHLWLRFDWDVDGEFDDDPRARATFGIFEGDPVQIYIQQTYQ